MSERLTLADLQFEARLRDYIERERARWEAQFKHHPPGERELDEFAQWEAMVVDREVTNFYFTDISWLHKHLP